MGAVLPNLIDRLRTRGYRLTAQRRTIAEVLVGANVHPTADEVHDLASVDLPEISRATVYSTLQQFAELGEIRELRVGGRPKRYDPNIAPLHHHLVCGACGALFDVAHEVSVPALDAADRHGMTISHAEIIYHGTCAACA